MLRRKLRLHAALVPPLLAVFFVFGLNIVLLRKVGEVLSRLDAVDTGFLVSIPVFLVSVFNIAFTILCTRRVTKPLFIFLMVLSSMLTYAMYTYGIVFDKNMVANFMQTDYIEAVSYLNPSILGWFFTLGLLPSILLLRTEIVYPSFRRATLQKAASVAVSLAAIGLIAVFHFKDYASVIRNNTTLRKQIVPIYAMDSVYGYMKKTYFTKPIPYRQIATGAQQDDPDIGQKKELVVLVVGETQRAMNYELNGYARPTNAYTKKHDVVFFPHTTSCGTATAVSVPCMFSNLGRAGYKEEVAESQDNLLDIIKRTGVHVLWIDNDSGCKGVCKNVETVDIRQKYKDDPRYCGKEGCYDDAFLKEFAEQYDKLPDSTGLVILHIMGSHGPTYYARYPESHRAFAPDCPRSDIQNCTQEELVNTYDNTILFSDYVMGGIIDILKKGAAKRNAALMFMSDHGESLGEKGVYLHGMPYAIAPEEQTHIPFLVWMDDAFAEDRGINLACVRQTLPQKPWSHDNLFHTALGLVDIEADTTYQKDKDVFSSCRSDTGDRG